MIMKNKISLAALVAFVGHTEVDSLNLKMESAQLRLAIDDGESEIWRKLRQASRHPTNIDDCVQAASEITRQIYANPYLALPSDSVDWLVSSVMSVRHGDNRFVKTELMSLCTVLMSVERLSESHVAQLSEVAKRIIQSDSNFDISRQHASLFLDVHQRTLLDGSHWRYNLVYEFDPRQEVTFRYSSHDRNKPTVAALQDALGMTSDSDLFTGNFCTLGAALDRPYELIAWKQYDDKTTLGNKGTMKIGGKYSIGLDDYDTFTTMHQLLREGQRLVDSNDQCGGFVVWNSRVYFKTVDACRELNHMDGDRPSGSHVLRVRRRRRTAPKLKYAKDLVSRAHPIERIVDFSPQSSEHGLTAIRCVYEKVFVLTLGGVTQEYVDSVVEMDKKTDSVNGEEGINTVARYIRIRFHPDTHPSLTGIKINHKLVTATTYPGPKVLQHGFSASSSGLSESLFDGSAETLYAPELNLLRVDLGCEVVVRSIEILTTEDAQAEMNKATISLGTVAEGDAAWYTTCNTAQGPFIWGEWYNNSFSFVRDPPFAKDPPVNSVWFPMRIAVDTKSESVVVDQHVNACIAHIENGSIMPLRSDIDWLLDNLEKNWSINLMKLCVSLRKHGLLSPSDIVRIVPIAKKIIFPTEQIVSLDDYVFNAVDFTQPPERKDSSGGQFTVTDGLHHDHALKSVEGRAIQEIYYKHRRSEDILASFTPPFRHHVRVSSDRIDGQIVTTHQQHQEKFIFKLLFGFSVFDDGFFRLPEEDNLFTQDEEFFVVPREYVYRTGDLELVDFEFKVSDGALEGNGLAPIKGIRCRKFMYRIDGVEIEFREDRSREPGR